MLLMHLSVAHAQAWQGLKGNGVQAAQQQTVFTPDEFLAACKLTNVNLLNVVHGLEHDHLVLKVAGYADTLAQQQSQAEGPASTLTASCAPPVRALDAKTKVWPR